MYELTGVVRPTPNIEALNSRAEMYRSLSRAIGSAAERCAQSTNTILSENEGRAADAFRSSQTGNKSLLEHAKRLAAAAAQTSSIYLQAAQISQAGAFTMDNIASIRKSQLALLKEPLFPASVVRSFVSACRAELVETRNHTISKLEDVFSRFPKIQEYGISPKDQRGRLTSEMAKRWDEFARSNPEKAKEALQRMADDYAERNGLPKIKIVFTAWYAEDPKKAPSSGSYSYTNDGQHLLKINEAFIDGRGLMPSAQVPPHHLINSVFHEMEHYRQYRAMKEWPPYTRASYGMTFEEARRWRQLNSDHVRKKGALYGVGDEVDNNRYRHRPVEVGARIHGAYEVNNMTPEELERYING